MLEAAGETSLCLRVDPIAKCVKLYPNSEWEKIDAQFTSKLNMWNKDDQRLYRQFASSVEQVEIDASGRVLIQKKYLDIIGVDTEALFVGMGSYFEIWKSENLEDGMIMRFMAVIILLQYIFVTYVRNLRLILLSHVI